MAKKLPLLIIGVLACFLLISVAVVLIIRDATIRAVAPVEAANANMGTEVANLLHPTPTILPDPMTIIHEVRSLARLETIQYSVEKVVTGDSGGVSLQPLFGDRLLFVAHGVVVAGIDLNKMTDSDLKLENGILKIWLPDPEIFSATLDNEKSYVFDRQTGILSRPNPDLETQVRRVGEQEIYKAAVDDGILDQARVNGENYLIRLLQDLGFKDVLFITTTPTPGPD